MKITQGKSWHSFFSTAELYVDLRLNLKELDSSSIHSSKKGYASAELRYDAQYATLDELN